MAISAISRPDLPCCRDRRWRCLVAAWLATGVCCLTWGCVDENPPVAWPAVNAARFACEVQPVLAKQCAAPACHGNPQRRMQVLAPGRMRLIGELLQASALQSLSDREAGAHPPLTQAELDFNFEQARGMAWQVDTHGGIALLTFPLAVPAGGIYHAPNGDVFLSRRDPGYVALAQWAIGQPWSAGRAGCP